MKGAISELIQTFCQEQFAHGYILWHPQKDVKWEILGCVWDSKEEKSSKESGADKTRLSSSTKYLITFFFVSLE